jgi:hypothetical protein
MSRPDPALVAAYLDGRLPPAESESVAAALDALPPDALDALLAAAAPPPLPSGPPSGPAFAPAPRPFADGRSLGGGASGVVVESEDRLLGRAVALKRLRPRAADEPLAAYLARADAFRREAALTAGLEHPGVVPVHDIGTGPLGEPAFAMKRLAGGPLAALLVRAPLAPAQAVDIALRVADAVGFAHARGVVHRDLKPEHVWIGEHGEVTVLDWGLAARCGADPRRAGTPGWMAPEQEAGAAADPRMDVWALGGLLAAMLGQAGPRGLRAIAARCRAGEPAARYPDGAAVAADLRRWLADGLSHAESPGPLARAAAALRRNPLLAATALLGLAAGGLAAWLPWSAAEAARAEARAAVRGIEAAAPVDAAQAAALRARLAPLLTAHPDLPEARLAEARLGAAERLFEDEARRRLLAETFDALDRSWRVRGPWPDEPAQLEAALAAAGVFAPAVPGTCPAESHPEAARVRRALVQLQRARLLAGLPPDPRIPALLAGCTDRAWSAVGRVIAGAEVVTHDLAAPMGDDLAAALADAATADLALATFAPDPRLAAAAERRLAEDPGAFWPRVCLGRAALAAGAWPAVREHALVALGREPASVWPRLLLGYGALAAGDWGALLVEATHAAAANPDHLEAGIMQAIALARLGRGAEAAARLAVLRADGHLRWHLANRHGHPMEALADAVLAAGLPLAEAPPRLTPLVPNR